MRTCVSVPVNSPLSQGLVSSLMEQSPEEIGDLYLDVGEAYLEEGEYMSALPLLSALVISEKYNLAVVWLRHAGGTEDHTLFTYLNLKVE